MAESAGRGGGDKTNKAKETLNPAVHIVARARRFERARSQNGSSTTDGHEGTVEQCTRAQPVQRKHYDEISCDEPAIRIPGEGNEPKE